MTDQQSNGSEDPGQPQQRPDFWLPPQQPEPSDDTAPQHTGAVPTAPPPTATPDPGNGTVRHDPGLIRETSVRNRRRWWLGIAVVVVLTLIITVSRTTELLGTTGDGGDHGGGRATDPTRSSKPSAPPVPERQASLIWKKDATTLRTDLREPELISTLDGDYSGPYLAEIDDRWLIATGDEHGDRTVVHALDPDTGAVVWQRRLEGALCMPEPPPSGIVCASILERDPATRAGKRWRLHLIDPADGHDRLTVDRDGWFTALHRSGSTIVAVEQRQPAPHAVLRGFGADDLRPRWSRDLLKVPGHDELFSADRIINRYDPAGNGMILDRPRFRDVGNGLLALWSGTRAAVIRPGDGSLIMMPHCSRLVDDGHRLWCNEVDGATSYSYAGKRLHRVTGPRLAFPDDDGIGTDRNRPVFIDAGGAPVAVDLRTGTVGKRYSVPGAGSAFGMQTMPSAETVDGHTFLVGEGGAMLVDPHRDKIIWRNRYVRLTDPPLIIGDSVLMGTGDLDVLDLRSGRRTAHVETEGTYVIKIGDRIAGVGLDGIVRQRF